jgi:DNA polymerase III subunit gamma/tau
VEPCGECTNCREIAAGRSLDVIELDAASHNKVEDVKPIMESVQFMPASSKYKIYIIDECHMLTNAAWNALLKTLEEPPPYVRFIFATTEGEKVLATIISRCQRFDLRRIQTNDIVSRLKHVCECEGIDAEEDALLAIARGAEGGMRDALSSLDQLISFCGNKVREEDALGVFGLVSRSALEGLAAAILKGDTAAILQAIETFDSAGKNMRRLSAELLQYFRNMVVVQALGENASSIAATSDQIKVLVEQSKLVDAGRVFRVCDQIAEMEDKLRYSLSVRTLIEMSLIRASRIATTATIEELMRAVKALKEGGAVTLPETAKSAAVEVPKPAPAPVAARPTRRHVLPSLPPEPAPSAPTKSAAVEPPTPAPAVKRPVDEKRRKELMDDPVLVSVIEALPGSQVIDIKGGK